MVEKISLFCGQRIEEMSREDMIEAIKILGTLYNESLEERMNCAALKPDAK